MLATKFSCAALFYLLNYKIWGTLQEQVYKTTKMKDVHELRERIVDEWDKLHQGQRIIDKDVEEWRKRLRACVVAGGGQFSHKT